MSYQFGINQLQSTTVPNAKYKTILCRHYQATKQCAIGSKCQFAHGIEEQRQMNDPLPASALSSITTASQSTTIEQQQKNQSPLFKIPCKYHQLNFCKNGSGCQYVHGMHLLVIPNRF
ncbi:unnamed protein product [Paramecium primaurelia]|uniref:C3H1-type domain-containing protein n=1 Tax=Paramecium primaurelia TaxID=5886 RepID=A0A8S1K8X3_PARPR|nr:unnamed protein product [Paramecium primaurelia]CAD8051689.1 unnamed protein product [Paramecium primaurelia]